MTSVIIPASIEDAIPHLVAIEGLVTAKGWERAAIVWAFVERPGSGKSTSGFSIFSFAALGIAGLRSGETVARYFDAWQTAIDDGYAKPSRPGRPCALPEVEKHPFPPGGSIDQTVSRNPKAVARQVIEDDDFAVKIVEQMTEAEADHFLHIVAEARWSKNEDEETFQQNPEPDFAKLLANHANGLSRVIAAERSGRWVPDALSEALLYFLTQALGERHQPANQVDFINGKLEKMYAEIEDYANSQQP